MNPSADRRSVRQEKKKYNLRSIMTTYTALWTCRLGSGRWSSAFERFAPSSSWRRYRAAPQAEDAGGNFRGEGGAENLGIPHKSFSWIRDLCGSTRTARSYGTVLELLSSQHILAKCGTNVSNELASPSQFYSHSVVARLACLSNLRPKSSPILPSSWPPLTGLVFPTRVSHMMPERQLRFPALP